MKTGPHTWQKLEYFRVLHITIDELERQRTFSVAEYATIYHRYMNLFRRFGEHGTVKDVA